MTSTARSNWSPDITITPAATHMGDVEWTCPVHGFVAVLQGDDVSYCTEDDKARPHGFCFRTCGAPLRVAETGRLLTGPEPAKVSTNVGARWETADEQVDPSYWRLLTVLEQASPHTLRATDLEALLAAGPPKPEGFRMRINALRDRLVRT